MKLLFLVAVVSASNAPYPCPIGMYMDGTSTTPTEDKCCKDAFDCSTTQLCDDTQYKSTIADYQDEDSVSNCCYPRNCMSAGHTCGDDQMLLSNNIGNATVTTDADCCYNFTFVAKCSTINMDGDEFACSDGTVYNSSTWNDESPTQAKCCEVHVPTCTHKSGPESAKVAQTCASGDYVYQDTTDPTEASCCQEYVGSCYMPTYMSEPIKCPAGSVEQGAIIWYGSSTTIEECCLEEQTCAAYSQLNCGASTQIGCPSGKIKVNTNFVSGYGVAALEASCCIADPDFSGAASVAASLSVLVVLL